MEKMLSLKAVVSSEVDKISGQATVYLISEDLQAILPIGVDLASAESILVAQQNVPLPRPHTHDLIRRLLLCLNAKLVDVVIYDLQEDIFYAYLRVMHNGDYYEIDARPSDAIALALRLQIPILTTEDLLLKGGLKLTENFVEA
jgi:bifunctional DNase/RNase